MTIEIITTYTTPTLLTTGGRALLDLQEIPEMVGRVQRMTDGDKLTVNPEIKLSLPATPANDFHLLRYVRPHGVIVKNKISVVVQSGIVTHPYTTMRVDSYQSGYQVTLYVSEENWEAKAAKIKISDIDLGSYVHSKSVIETRQATAAYSDGGTAHQFPIAHYGKWLYPYYSENFRPWVYLKAILDEGLCLAGVKFRSPFYESAVGRRLICYLLRKDYLNDQARLDRRRFLATLNTTTYRFTTEVLDPGSNYNPTTMFFNGRGTYDFGVDLTFTILRGGRGTAVIVTFMRDDFTVIERFRYDTVGKHEISVSAKSVQIGAGQGVTAVVTVVDPGYTTWEGGRFYNEPLTVGIEDGETVEIKKLLRTDITVLDVLKAAISATNGLLEYKNPEKELWLYSPYDADVNGTSVAGYFTDNLNNIEALHINENTDLYQVDNGLRQRYIRIGWKASTCEYIKKNNQPDNLFGTTIDRGEEYEGDTLDLTNPLFEPTLTGKAFDVSVYADAPATIPHLWDNEDNKVSYDLAPRILYYTGLVPQFVDNAGTAVQARLRTGRQTTSTSIPFAYMETEAKTTSLAEFSPLFTLSQDKTSLYQWCWRRDTFTRLIQGRYLVNILATPAQFKALSHRDLFTVSVLGRTMPGRLLEKTYNEQDGQARLVLMPEPPVPVECLDFLEDAAEKASKDVLIKFTVDPTGPKITAIGENPTGIVIVAEDWKYWLVAGTPTSYTPGTQIDLDQQITFEYTAEFSDGDIVKVTRTVDPEMVCFNNQPGIKLTTLGSKVKAEKDNNILSTIDTETWTYAVDGGTEQPYTPGTYVGGAEDVYFKYVVTYTDFCPDTETYALYEFTSEDLLCVNEPEIEFTDLGACMVIPVLTGSVESATHTVYWEVKNGSEAYKAWDGNPILNGTNTTVRATVIFCDACPPVCVEKTCV